jgi:hypothetical protein
MNFAGVVSGDGSGGCIYVQDNASVSFSRGVELTSNVASVDAGAVGVYGSARLMLTEDVVIADNEAYSGVGGGMTAGENATVELRSNVLLRNNTGGTNNAMGLAVIGNAQVSM